MAFLHHETTSKLSWHGFTTAPQETCMRSAGVAILPFNVRTNGLTLGALPDSRISGCCSVMPSFCRAITATQHLIGSFPTLLNDSTFLRCPSHQQLGIPSKGAQNDGFADDFLHCAKRTVCSILVPLIATAQTEHLFCLRQLKTSALFQSPPFKICIKG